MSSAKITPLPIAPSTIAHYKLESEIGQGRFGRVYRARDTRTQERVAIKTIYATPFDKRSLQYIAQEVKSMKALEHDNIVRLHAVYEMPADELPTEGKFPVEGAVSPTVAATRSFTPAVNTLYCLVMELLEGGDLCSLIIRKKKLAEEHVRRLFQQVISGIEHMHASMVCHRDIKAENIFLDIHVSDSDNESMNKVNLKIGDFGLSTFYSRDTLQWQSCGSLDYAAPEIVTGSSYFGPEVDVWSTGVLLYGMLCGYLPFKRPTRDSVVESIKRGQFSPMPAHVSKGARLLVERILTPDPLKRATLQDIKKDPWLVGTILPEAGPDTRQLTPPLSPLARRGSVSMQLATSESSSDNEYEQDEDTSEKADNNATEQDRALWLKELHRYAVSIKKGPEELIVESDDMTEEEKQWQQEHKRIAKYVAKRNNRLQGVVRERRYSIGPEAPSKVAAAVRKVSLPPIVRWS